MTYAEIAIHESIWKLYTT